MEQGSTDVGCAVRTAFGAHGAPYTEPFSAMLEFWLAGLVTEGAAERMLLSCRVPPSLPWLGRNPSLHAALPWSTCPWTLVCRCGESARDRRGCFASRCLVPALSIYAIIRPVRRLRSGSRKTANFPVA